MSAAETWYRGGLRFACRRCGACCTGEPGYVFLGTGEAEALAGHLGLAPAAFAARHLRRVCGGVSLREEADGRCTLWDGACRAYAVRPRQCRSYPFWPRVVASREEWEREGAACPGIGSGALHAAGEIDDALRRG